MKLHKYKSYDEYVSIQIQGNKANANGQWVEEDEIKFLSDYLSSSQKGLGFGICHGSKQGNEQKWFRKYTGAEVIGTDITDVAEKYTDTIRWDFHETKSEWINKVDFIYSNAFDHSYDPEKCLKSWMSCVKKEGCCIIEWSLADIRTTQLDPFGATLEEYEDLINKCGFKVKDKLKMDTGLRGIKTYIIVGHKN